MDGHEELNGVKAEPVVVTRNGNDEDWDFDKWDITNAYGEHDKFFKKVDNSEKAKQKREYLRRSYFRGYSDKMITAKNRYDVNNEANKSHLKQDMDHRDVKGEFLEMDGNNPMMAFATEVSESVNEPPYFETHINESSHGSNIANISQHTFVRFHATVYNKELRRMIRYVFAVGHHGGGLGDDYHSPSTIAVRKQVTYDDVQKGFAFINRYRINRNEDWKLFTTNCNRFAKSVAESMGFQDMAKLHNNVSCVGSFNRIRKAMYKNLASKNKDLQFFSMEQYSKEETVPKKMRFLRGDVQSDPEIIHEMAEMRLENMVGMPVDTSNTFINTIESALLKDLKLNSLEELKQVKDNYNAAVDQNKFIWFKKKKQRQIAIYDAYKAMDDFIKSLYTNEGYGAEIEQIAQKVKTGEIDQKEFEVERDQLRVLAYNQWLGIADNLILATKGLKETSIKALKMKGDIMSYKAMLTNEGDVSTIAHQGFGNYHEYAMDKLEADDIYEEIYHKGKELNKNDKEAVEAALKIVNISEDENLRKKEKNVAANGHFILQRIMDKEGDCIDLLPSKRTVTPVEAITNVFGKIHTELEQKNDNKRLKDYLAMLVDKKVGFSSSSEVMAWCLSQFIIMAVRDLWQIRMKADPLVYEDSDEIKTRTWNLENFWEQLYNDRISQATIKGTDVNLSPEKKVIYSNEPTSLLNGNQLYENEKNIMLELTKHINGIYAKLKTYTDKLFNPA